MHKPEIVILDGVRVDAVRFGTRVPCWVRNGSLVNKHGPVTYKAMIMVVASSAQNVHLANRVYCLLKTAGYNCQQIRVDCSRVNTADEHMEVFA